MMGGFMALAELRRLADEPQPDTVLLKTDADSRRPTRLPCREIYLHHRGLSHHPGDKAKDSGNAKNFSEFGIDG